jgi:hypothetical protein
MGKPKNYLDILEHVRCSLHEICEPTVIWRQVPYPGRLYNSISCHIDRLLHAKSLSSEISQVVVFIGRKALSGYYEPQDVEKYCIEQVGY